jgi:hypothetical protein
MLVSWPGRIYDGWMNKWMDEIDAKHTLWGWPCIGCEVTDTDGTKVATLKGAHYLH